jgi:hypothetical protein
MLLISFHPCCIIPCLKTVACCHFQGRVAEIALGSLSCGCLLCAPWQALAFAHPECLPKRKIVIRVCALLQASSMLGLLAEEVGLACGMVLRQVRQVRSR